MSSDLKSVLSKIPSPLRQPEPSKITYSELYNYESLSMKRWNLTKQRYIAALPYFGKFLLLSGISQPTPKFRKNRRLHWTLLGFESPDRQLRPKVLLWRKPKRRNNPQTDDQKH